MIRRQLQSTLGVAAGNGLEILNETGFNAVGVDLDEGMLAGCREHGLNARRAEALQTLREMPSSSVALVSAFHVVEHMPFDDVRTLVGEALRVLKPGGLLIMETPNPENLRVATSLFYLDPTHVRPVPPELLSFATEYVGFHRNVVVRLQESPTLRTDAKINLINVLSGVSPDYGIVAQKGGAPSLLSEFDRPFNASYGITLDTIAQRYEDQGEIRQAEIDARHLSWAAHAENKFTLEDNRFTYLDNRDAHLETRIERIENWIAQLWRLTAPVRWVSTQMQLLRQNGVTARVKSLVKKVARPFIVRGIAVCHGPPHVAGSAASTCSGVTWALFGVAPDLSARIWTPAGK